MSDYAAFLRDKIKLARFTGFDVPLEDINPALKPHTLTVAQRPPSDPLKLRELLFPPLQTPEVTELSPDEAWMVVNGLVAAEEGA